MEDKSKVTSLLRLAKQFPPQLVSTIKKGNREEDYIKHSVIAHFFFPNTLPIPRRPKELVIFPNLEI